MALVLLSATFVTTGTIGSCQRRVAVRVEEISETRSFNDIARAAKAQAEFDILTRELARAVGLARSAGARRLAALTDLRE